MSTARLSKPRLQVTLEESDGTAVELIVQSDNRDRVRWDLTRNKKGWPALQDAPFLGLAFLAWAALTRGGDLTEKFEDFQDRCVAVVAVNTDGEPVENPEELDVGPTTTDQGSVSS